MRVYGNLEYRLGIGTELCSLGPLATGRLLTGRRAIFGVTSSGAEKTLAVRAFAA
jgi:hypothetical protein